MQNIIVFLRLVKSPICFFVILFITVRLLDISGISCLLSRACLKKAFCKMCVTICGRFCPDEGAVAGYGNRIRVKYTAKWGCADCGNDFQKQALIHRILSNCHIDLSAYWYRYLRNDVLAVFSAAISSILTSSSSVKSRTVDRFSLLSRILLWNRDAPMSTLVTSFCARSQPKSHFRKLLATPCCHIDSAHGSACKRSWSRVLSFKNLPSVRIRLSSGMPLR